MRALGVIPIDLWAFEGRWAVSREIADTKGADGQFAGEALFTREGAGLRYVETGVLRVGAAQMQAERQYTWTSGAGIEVWFEDGRFFHRFDLAETAAAAHDCPPDWYEVSYNFGAWPAWSSRWRVPGPRKDYVMTSRYVRAELQAIPRQLSG
jgi:hypothetical protein